MKNHNHRYGFTLIELIVTVAIISLLVGMGAISYRTFSRTQEAQSAAYEVQQMLRTAQLKARVKDTPDDCDALQNYTISASAGVGQTIVITPICSGGPSSAIITRTLPASIRITDINSITFQTLGGGTSLANPLTVDVSNASGTPLNTFRIRITPGGSISEPVKQ